MDSESSGAILQRVQHRLKLFFPEEQYTEEILQEALDVGDIFYKPDDILRYLQTALMDDKVLEAEIDGLTRIYFSRLYDDFPPLEEHEEEDGNIVLVEPEYAPAEYLKKMAYFNSWPFEPAIGNMAVRNSKKVLFRLFTSSYAVELGTQFQNIVNVREENVLRFEYPVIGRIVRGSRAFRAKVPAAMNLSARVEKSGQKEKVEVAVLDISARGMSVLLRADQHALLEEDDNANIEVLLDESSMVMLNCNVRHISKIRGKKGSEYMCGVQFDLENREIAAKVESVVAQVQRNYLKELSEISQESGCDLIP